MVKEIKVNGSFRRKDNLYILKEGRNIIGFLMVLGQPIQLYIAYKGKVSGEAVYKLGEYKHFDTAVKLVLNEVVYKHAKKDQKVNARLYENGKPTNITASVGWN